MLHSKNNSFYIIKFILNTNNENKNEHEPQYKIICYAYFKKVTFSIPAIYKKYFFLYSHNYDILSSVK